MAQSAPSVHCARLATACRTVSEEANSEEWDDRRLLALLLQVVAQTGYAQEQRYAHVCISTGRDIESETISILQSKP